MSEPQRPLPRAWAVIPAKSLAEGKSRLATVLSPSERHQLSREFLRHTLEIVTALSCLEGVVVVSPDPDALALAREFGAHALAEDSPSSLNAALTLAASWAERRGATHVMTVSTDLPWLLTAELQAVWDRAFAAGPPGVTLAPDDAAQGTNVMVVAPPGLIEYRYGIGSCENHRAAAIAAGAAFSEIRRPGLLFDVDSPDDLNQWQARHGTGVSPAPAQFRRATDATENAEA